MGKHRAQRFTSNQVEMIEIGGPENLGSKQVAQLYTRLPGGLAKVSQKIRSARTHLLSVRLWMKERVNAQSK